MTDDAQKKDYFMSNTAYDYLRFCTRLLFPGMAIAYFVVADTVGLPDTPTVLRTLLLIEFLLGAVLHYSTYSYNKSEGKFAGYINITHNAIDRRKIFTLDLNRDPTELEHSTELLFKVVSPALDEYPPGENRIDGE